MSAEGTVKVESTRLPKPTHRHLVTHEDQGFSSGFHHHGDDNSVMLPDSVILVDLAEVRPMETICDAAGLVLVRVVRPDEDNWATRVQARKRAYAILAACEALDRDAKP